MGSRVKQNPENTFEVYVEVSRPGENASRQDPELQRIFPEDFSDQEVLQTVTKFCFPFSLDSLSASQVGQNFTFVLTDIDSKHRFGFCRLSSGAKSCFCILSYLPWFEVFYKLLNILADYSLKNQDNQRNELLETLYRLPIPEPGSEVHLSVHSYFTVPDSRELPSIPENRNLTEYFVAVDVNNMLHLYASMLYERRILICCSKLSTLTACIHGSSAMLFPMHWQHVYIPVLPPHLLDYCCAPMPYLIGIHSSLMEKVKSMSLEDVVVLNVDTNTLETPFDDLQNLPSEVVSALKNRLRKVSTTTGDGVARAFLKAQASLFGSYRSALKIEPEEPITFCEDTFVSHRSSGMRPFLQNAIQLQLFKQFIDGRLDLLNTGNGFSDVFEEEINMGEYAGSDKLYHQWLSTVKKGSGAFLNTMKTRANPAMKNVYKFAKDHAKMGIKEVKNRLKQKDLTENGCSVAVEEPLPRMSPSPSAEKKDLKAREERRPITVHFGQQEKLPPPRPPPPRIQRNTVPVRPPRPNVARRPKSNAVVESRRTSISSPDHVVKPTRHYTVFLSEDSSDDEFLQEEDPVSAFSENFIFSAPFEWPQQYRTLKESDADGDEIISPEKESDSVLDHDPSHKEVPNINLLEDIFSNFSVESQPPLLSQAKSLEDLRTPKDDHEDHFTFDYQRMDLTVPERNRLVPPMKYNHPYNKLWSMGQDDMAIPNKYLQVSPEEQTSLTGSDTSTPHREITSLSVDKEGTSGISSHGNITIPRPHGRKTPELGIVPPPPAPRVSKQQNVPAVAESGTLQLGENIGFPLQTIQGPFGEPSVSDGHRQVSDSSSMDLLQPVKVSTDISVNDDILSLLDPLMAAQGQSDPMHPLGSGLQSSEAPHYSSTPCFTSLHSDFTPAAFPHQLGYSTPQPAFIHSPLNPFIQAMPPDHSISVIGITARPFTPPVVSNSPFSRSVFYHSQRRPTPALPGSSSLSNVPSGMTVNTLMQQSQMTSETRQNIPPIMTGLSGHRTFPMTKPPAKPKDKPREYPAIPPRPSKNSDPVLLPSRPGQPKDPFDELLSKTKEAVTPTPGKVEQLRKRWETFE
ncbi:DENN domain-containing protein 1A isoform X1 [Bufo gargarizans]|uniref:DENN domain-containing protein 1A isoform X1 n=1 Tax=Bufo gargarizans TaxID=30331 RepID=UPI001CF31D1E|nr:DENN domain-containing protein 1A isoform X1 [Bufo gargarizans]